MLKIRLTRMGKKHQPAYRVVVTPKETPTQGGYLENLGLYNPIQGVFQVNAEKTMEWLNKGAMPSERVARLLDKAGLKHKSIVVKTYVPKPKEEVAEEAPVAPVAPEAAAEETTETEEVTSTEETTPEAPEAEAAEPTEATE